jgi:hypothetical protein
LEKPVENGISVGGNSLSDVTDWFLAHNREKLISEK